MQTALFEDRSKNVILGHNRLSIVELSDAGSQPMVDNSGDWIITYNGELYNYDKFVMILLNVSPLFLRVKVILKLFCMELNIMASMNFCEEQTVCLLFVS